MFAFAASTLPRAGGIALRLTGKRSAVFRSGYIASPLPHICFKPTHHPLTTTPRTYTTTTSTMPPGPVLPTLSLWAQSHITALFKATTTEEFDDAFDAFLAKHTDSIVVNGEKLSRDAFKNRLQSARALERSAEVKYLGTVEVKDEKEGEKVCVLSVGCA